MTTSEPAPNEIKPEWIKRSIDSMADLTKQLITLSTGVLTLTLTFFSVFLSTETGQSNAPGWAKLLLAISWVLLIISIIGGLLTLSAITGNQAVYGEPDKAKDRDRKFVISERSALFINLSNVRGTSLIQWITFIVALALEAAAVIGTI